MYPQSRGRVLRHVGADLEGAVELLVDHHLRDVRAFKEGLEATVKLRAEPFTLPWIVFRRQEASEWRHVGVMMAGDKEKAVVHIIGTAAFLGVLVVFWCCPAVASGCPSGTPSSCRAKAKQAQAE